MKKQLTILVTGAGALVGQGILRLLREIKRPLRIITADPDHKSAGHWLGDKAYLIPMAKDPDFGKVISNLIIKENVDIVFVGTDVELTYFSNNKSYLEALGTKVVVCPPEAVEIADDKWLTVNFLKDNGFDYPRSILASEDKEECEAFAAKYNYHLFAKPRRGARSVGARIIKNEYEFHMAQQNEKHLIFQELLPGDEYTAGCVGFNKKVGGTVVLRRDLRDGNTFKAYHDGTDKFEKQIEEIATKLQIDGPCNFQFKVRNDKPVIFEFNARCSGTTPIRSLFGFNEVEAVINNIIDGKPITSPKLRAGAVLRTTSDIFIDEHQMKELSDNKELSNPIAESMHFINARNLCE